MKSILLKLSSIIVCTLAFFILFDVSTYAECNHEWSPWEVISESDCTSKGYEERYCYNCYSYETRDLPLKAHSWSSWSLDQKSTPYVRGYKSRYCTYCDKEERVYLEKTKLTKNQKKAVAVVNTYMKAVKSYNVKKMNSCFASKTKKYGYPTKITNKIFKKNNKKIIKWTITNITGGGKKYTVSAKVTQPDYYDTVFDIFYDTLMDAWNHNKDGTKAGIRAASKTAEKLKKRKVKKSTKIYKFSIIKKGSKWKIKKKNRTMVDIACGFQNIAVDDAIDQYLEDLF